LPIYGRMVTYSIYGHSRPKHTDCSMRVLSWLLSLLLHAAAAFLLTASVRYTLPHADRQLINVELTESPPQEKSTTPTPPTSLKAPEKPTKMPLNKTIVLSGEPVAQPDPKLPPSPQKQPVPVVRPKPISPSVSEFAPELKGSESSLTVNSAERRGPGAQLGVELYSAFYSYSPEEFAGQFKAGADRVVTIIDARKTRYGRLLIYDSKRGELRRLRQFNKYIYTIGPSLYEDKPVTGSVTFLAKDDRIERFIYLPEGEKAFFPKKVHFREKKIRIPLPDGPLDAILTLPPRKGSYPGAVLLHGTTCLDPSMVQGAVRAFGMRGTALLAFSPASCAKSTMGGGPLAREAVSVLQRMREHPEVRAEKTGFLGVGAGVPEAVRAAQELGAKPAFLISVLCNGVPPDIRDVARMNIPSLWIIPDDKRLNAFAQGLEALRDKRHRPVTLIIDRESKTAARDEAEQLAEVITDGHAALAASWLEQLFK